jgi:hypothetical protein
MGLHVPRHSAAFTFAVLTVVFGIVTVVLDGIVNNNCSNNGPATSGFGSVYCAATGTGIAAGSMAIAFGILAMIWLMTSEMAESLAMRTILTIGLILTAALGLVAGVLNAYVSARVADDYVHHMTAAASATNFALMITSVVTGALCWRAPLVAVQATSARV